MNIAKVNLFLLFGGGLYSPIMRIVDFDDEMLRSMNSKDLRLPLSFNFTSKLFLIKSQLLLPYPYFVGNGKKQSLEVKCVSQLKYNHHCHLPLTMSLLLPSHPYVGQ